MSLWIGRLGRRGVAPHRAGCGRALVAGLSLLLAACGSGERVIILKAALSQNPSEPQVRAVELFAELVSEGTEGRIRVQIYPNNQLGNQRDVVEGLQMGSVELANIASVMASTALTIHRVRTPRLAPL